MLSGEINKDGYIVPRNRGRCPSLGTLLGWIYVTSAAFIIDFHLFSANI